MTDKNQLNNEELNKVSGGTLKCNSNSYENEYTHKIDKYDTVNYIGQDLLFKSVTTERYNNQTIDKKSFVFGTLVDSYEKEKSCGTTRTAKVYVKYSSGCVTFNCNANTELSLDKWGAYSK